METDILAAAVRMIILLPLVTVLAYFLIKYGLARKPFIYGGRRRMRLIEQIPLGPKTVLSLVEVGGRYILLAHSENGFHVIREMEEMPEPIQQQDLEAAGWKGMLEDIGTAAGRNGLLGKLLTRNGRQR